MKGYQILFLMLLGIVTSCNLSAQKSDETLKKASLQLGLLNSYLELDLKNQHEDARGLVERIRNQVRNKGNRSNDISMLKKAEHVVQIADTLFNELNAIKERLKNEAHTPDFGIAFQKEWMLDRGKGKDIAEMIQVFDGKLNKEAFRAIEPILADDGGDFVMANFQSATANGTASIITTIELNVQDSVFMALYDYAAYVGAK